MKLPLKLLLALAIFIVSLYAAIPLWLPYMLAGQLPPGWQLEQLEADYPGISSIDIHRVQVKGKLQSAGLTLSATDLRFTYRGLKTEVDSILLDVFMQTGEAGTLDDDTDALTLDDLSFPVTNLTGQLPDLSVTQLRATLHPVVIPDKAEAGPLVVDLRGLRLVPGTGDELHITTALSIESVWGIAGQLKLDVNGTARKVELRFPAAESLPPWLTISAEQKDHALKTTTQVVAVFDTEAAAHEWLDVILTQTTGGWLSHVNGYLRLQAEFAGIDSQAIEQLLLSTEHLQAEFEDGALTVDADVLASREGEKIVVTLPRSARLSYEDKAAGIDGLLTSLIPGLQRSSQAAAMAEAELAVSSTFLIQTGNKPSIKFEGGVDLDLSAAEQMINLQTADIQIELADISRPDSILANGSVTINWVESAPFTYTSEDEGSSAITVSADEMSISTELLARNGSFVGTGNGTYLNASIMPFAISAAKVDISWQELDLFKLKGKFTTRTNGFATEFDDKMWSGFDFDIAYSMAENANLDGSGKLIFDAGTVLPIEFAGNTQADQWAVMLPASTIRLAELDDLLRVAHFELPASIKLVDGYIAIKGDVRVGDEITANMAVNGTDIEASMLESHARDASFNLEAGYDEGISAKGPVIIPFLALAGGIDVTQLRTELDLEDTDTFTLGSFYAELFDGQLMFDHLQFSENRIEKTTLELSEINLGLLLAFVDVEGLEGTGKLDMSLPAGSDETGIYIHGGTFESTIPGRLAYTKEGVAGSNIGLQAMENFQYKALSGTLDYQSDGAYQIVLHLEGKNPDLYGGHPIVFNLNISGALPELFEALFITGNFEESVLNQIKTN